MKDFVVVIPTLNEEETIESTINEIIDTQSSSFFGPRLRKIIIVDDNSTDDTIQLIKGHPEYENHIVLIQKPVRYHIRDSIQLGFEESLKYKKDIEYVVVMDAGNSWNFDEIYRHLNTTKMGVIAGYRNKKELFKKNWKRALLSSLGTFVFNIINIKWFKDCTCGFRAYNIELVKRMDWSKIMGRRFDIQLSLMSYLRNTSIYWVPVEYSYTTSSLNIKTVFSSWWYSIKSIFYKPKIRPSEEEL